MKKTVNYLLRGAIALTFIIPVGYMAVIVYYAPELLVVFFDNVWRGVLPLVILWVGFIVWAIVRIERPIKRS